MSALINAGVMSDTDIIVHMVKGGIFFEIVPLIFDVVYIPPKVEEELNNKHKGILGQFSPWLNKDSFLKRTKESFINLPPERKILINKTKTRLRASLDPGELDCYAYSKGMEIDTIISDDKGAKELISIDSNNEKVVITFWDMLILAAKCDKIAWSDAEVMYDNVINRANLKLPPFKKQVELFDTYCGSHPIIKKYLSGT